MVEGKQARRRSPLHHQALRQAYGVPGRSALTTRSEKTPRIGALPGPGSALRIPAARGTRRRIGYEQMDDYLYDSAVTYKGVLELIDFMELASIFERILEQEARRCSIFSILLDRELFFIAQN